MGSNKLPPQLISSAVRRQRDECPNRCETFFRACVSEWVERFENYLPNSVLSIKGEIPSVGFY
jgi:hypothetical protein